MYGKFSKIKILSMILIIVLLAGFYLYARYLGIKGLQTHEYNIMSEDIPNEFNGFTIAQFSDFLYGGTTDIDTLSNLVDKINDYKPNVLVFTGDLIKSDYTLNEDEQNKIIEVLNKLNVEQNKFYILGDTDVDKEQIQPGDIVQLGNEKNEFYHSLIILGIKGDDVFIAAHSEDAYMRELNSYKFDKVRYIHILGANKKIDGRR